MTVRGAAPPNPSAHDRADDQPNVGVLLFVSYRAMESQVMQSLADAGFADLTLAQARIFQRIGPDGTRLTDLAEQSQVTKQTAGFLIDQLERAGYVERTPDARDARARLVRISRRGRQALPVAAAAVAVVQARWIEHLGVARWQELRESLAALREITDPYA